METWLWIFGSVISVSLLSLVGLFTISISHEKLGRFVGVIVSFAAGTLLGDAFLHLLPESFEENGTWTAAWALVGILIFFILEKFIHWRHCHDDECEQHPHAISYLILFGDTLHNFIDGIIIAASYLVSIPVGVATTVAVFFHEIPQEIGDFGSLVYGGFSRAKALLFNFFSALTAIAGAAIVVVLHGNGEWLVAALIPLSAGGFIYIANSDIIPELHRTRKTSQSLLQFGALLCGIGIMAILLLFE